MKLSADLEAKRMILPKEEFLEQITIEDVAQFIDDNGFKEHQVHYDGGHYCKNIKWHSIKNFTEKEKNILFDRETLEEVMDCIVIPAIKQFKEKTGHDIYTKGRMGGWIYCDAAKPEDDEFFENDQQDDEDDEDYDERRWQAIGLFEVLYDFQRWYDDVEQQVKEFLPREQEVTM